MIGDVLLDGAKGIADTINKLPPGSGKACWKRCDVTSWEDQVALFELGMKKFGGVDVAVSAALSSVRGWGIDFVSPRTLDTNVRSSVLGSEKFRILGRYSSRKPTGNLSGRISRPLM